jgi:hypothetical protein
MKPVSRANLFPGDGDRSNSILQLLHRETAQNGKMPPEEKAGAQRYLFWEIQL